MTSKTEFGLGDFQLTNRRSSWGPGLRFCLTTSSTIDGKTYAISVPSFFAMKKRGGEVSVYPPVSRTTPGKTYYAAMWSPDLQELVRAELERTGWLAKVGTNYDVGALASLEPDLSPDMPANAFTLPNVE